MRAIAIAAVIAVAACHGGGGASSGANKVPDAIAKLAKGGEAQPFDGWTVPGVTLYRIVVAVPDHTSTSIVGIDGKTGAVVTGPELIKRMGTTVPPAELAQRMFGAVISDTGRPLMPTETEHMFATEQEWKAVEAPAIVDGALVFYAFRGEMDPELVQYKIALDTLAITITDAVEVLVARGQTVMLGAAMCEPRVDCGCWSGCARFQRIAAPGLTDTTWIRVGTGGDPSVHYTRDHCGHPPCSTVCRADSPTANCDPALVAVDLGCTESCPPGEAPYHCDTLTDSCKQIDHPTRAKKVP